MIAILENAKTVGAVHTHTHTHTQCNLINKEQGIKNALLNIDFFKTDQLLI